MSESSYSESAAQKVETVSRPAARSSRRRKQWTLTTLADRGHRRASASPSTPTTLLVMPLVAQPALADLEHLDPLHRQRLRRHPQLGPLRSSSSSAVCGGVFGLLGGYLTDRFGRQPVLLWSILLSAASAARLRPASAHCPAVDAAGLPLHDVHRRVRRVRRRRRLAGGTLPQPEAARERPGLHAGVRVARRHVGRGRRTASSTRRTSRCPPSTTSHAQWRYALISARDPGAAAVVHPAVPARIAGLEAEAGGGDAAPAQHSGTVPARVPPRLDRHRPAVRLQLRRRVRRHPADAAARARPRARPQAAGAEAHRLRGRSEPGEAGEL